MPLFTLDQLEAAAALVGTRVPPTPQYAWPLLAERAGCEVWVKHENHTPIGAFKVRGGLVYMDEMRRSGVKEVATATRGNHGQSIPFAATPLGIRARIWAPEDNSVEKNAAMRAWGAELTLHGRDFDEARLECIRVAAEEGLHMVPSFHPLLVRGVATYALELLRAAPPLDVVYVPIGMGSGCCGLIETRDLLGLKTEIVGVVSAHADAYARSFEAGRAVETDSARTFADGMACRSPAEDALEIMSRGLARMVRVTDDEVADAMRALYADTHNLAEGSGATAFAALMQERERMAGRRAGVILSGGNVDRAWFAEVIAGRTPEV